MKTIEKLDIIGDVDAPEKIEEKINELIEAVNTLSCIISGVSSLKRGKPDFSPTPVSLFCSKPEC